MQHYPNLAAVSLTLPGIVTVGVFDGVHRGHQALIRTLVDAARARNHLAVVLTFFPHPDAVLRDIDGPYYLTGPQHRAALLGELGVDVVVTHPFTQDVSHIRAAAFVDLLKRHLNMSVLLATPDFALGHRREGDIPFLRQQAAQKDFVVHTVDLIADNDSGQVVRSSAIRDALGLGDVEQVQQLMGRAYRVEGEVIKGQQRGRQIGFPTANVAVWPQQLLPANGVYACRVVLNDEQYLAVTNIGQRPTFDGLGITVESHLLDFDRDIYGEHLQVDFVHRLRGEIKFPGVDALIEQIGADVDHGRRLLQR